jgi:hypothetical protein
VTVVLEEGQVHSLLERAAARSLAKGRPLSMSATVRELLDQVLGDGEPRPAARAIGG